MVDASHKKYFVKKEASEIFKLNIYAKEPLNRTHTSTLKILPQPLLNVSLIFLRIT